jgi:hypothetical protein
LSEDELVGAIEHQPFNEGALRPTHSAACSPRALVRVPLKTIICANCHCYTFASTILNASDPNWIAVATNGEGSDDLADAETRIGKPLSESAAKLIGIRLEPEIAQMAT